MENNVTFNTADEVMQYVIDNYGFTPKSVVKNGSGYTVTIDDYNSIDMPGQINSDTELMYYSRGGSVASDYSHNENVIIVHNNANHWNSQNTNPSGTEVYESICQAEGIGGYFGGFSNGGRVSVRSLCDYLAENPDADQQTIIITDSCTEGGGSNFSNIKVTAADLENFKENDTVFVLVQRSSQDPTNASSIQQIIKNGNEVICISSPYSEHSNASGNSSGICTRTFTDGIIDWVMGRSESFDSEKYRIQIATYDEATGQIVKTDMTDEQIKTWFLKNEFMANYSSAIDSSVVIKSDNAQLEDDLNDIVNTYKSLSLSSIESELTSTTKVPSAEPTIISNMIKGAIMLFNSISIDCVNVAKCGNDFSNLDLDATNMASELNFNISSKKNDISNLDYIGTYNDNDFEKILTESGTSDTVQTPSTVTPSTVTPSTTTPGSSKPKAAVNDDGSNANVKAADNTNDNSKAASDNTNDNSKAADDNTDDNSKADDGADDKTDVIAETPGSDTNKDTIVVDDDTGSSNTPTTPVVATDSPNTGNDTKKSVNISNNFGGSSVSNDKNYINTENLVDGIDEELFIPEPADEIVISDDIFVDEPIYDEISNMSANVTDAPVGVSSNGSGNNLFKNIAIADAAGLAIGAAAYSINKTVKNKNEEASE